MRITIQADPFLKYNEGKSWQQRGLWPCSWISCPEAGEPPFVLAFRKRFEVSRDSKICFHVSADERYTLFLDGERIGRGSERGAPDLWFYESHEIDLSPGPHVFIAKVWALGEQAACAQMSVRPGFLFAPEAEWQSILGTGLVEWECRRLTGYSFTGPYPASLRGARTCIDASQVTWDLEGEDQGWSAAMIVEPGVARRMDLDLPPRHLLHPNLLPPMLELTHHIGRTRLAARIPMLESGSMPDLAQIPVSVKDHLPELGEAFDQLIKGDSPVTLPANSAWRFIVDLEEYYCAYPQIMTSRGKGSSVEILWAESLYHTPDPWRGRKGNRDEIEGKYFIGVGDTFLLDGGLNRQFEPLWWQAGRYLHIVVCTADEPLTLERFNFLETRYPLEMESSFQTSDPRLVEIVPMLVRGLQMCANETYFDCPYYEELMYAGDTRLECLITYAITGDDRLPRKAIRMFDVSRLPSGLTQSRYPSRVKQLIAPFSLWWVGIVYDYALWRGDLPFLIRIMPGVRATLEGYLRFIREDGLVHSPEGWNVMDWVPEWDADAGAPPDGVSGISGLLNWQYAYVLAQAAELETMLGEVELADRNRRLAADLAGKAKEAFWDDRRGLLADDLAHSHFSEHTQCMAILSGVLDPAMEARVANGLLTDPDLSRTTIYFSHYLFETLQKIGRPDVLLRKLDLWVNLSRQGLKTTIEAPEPNRSDCHAWGAHPLFHYFATLLGIRPKSLGFRSVEIKPQLGNLEWASGKLVHPAGGFVEVEFHQEGGTLHGEVSLPEGIAGKLSLPDRSINLSGRRYNF